MVNGKKPTWLFRDPSSIKPHSLTVEVIADYAGGYSLDHAFNEVHQHFRRFDKKNFIKEIIPHPVFAFSTIETGFWIAQMALHSEHENLVIFSNTAPRGDIAWGGQKEQPFVYALLDNNVPVFAVHAGYNLSFIKEHIKGIWEVNVPNTGTQFRSRDQYPEATLALLFLRGETKVGKPVDLKSIPDVPPYTIASVDGYGNLKTTIRRSDLKESVRNAKIVRVSLHHRARFALNSTNGAKGKTGDFCMVVGSSGGKKNPYIEFVRLQARAAHDFAIPGPWDDLGKITIEAIV